MRKLLPTSVVLATLLAGCAAPEIGNPSPAAVTLTTTELRLRLTDGTRCVADWKAAGGSGRLQDCGPGYGYAVKITEPRNILRQLAEGLTLTLGMSDVLVPMAEVVITDPAGIDTVFTSP